MRLLSPAGGLAAALFIAALAGLVYWQFEALSDVRAQIQVQTAFEKIRADVRNLVLNPAAWDKTLAHPGNRAIMGPEKTLIDLLNASGSVEFATSDPSSGFTSEGRPCQTLGFGNCGIKLNLAVEPVCTDAACEHPARLVSARFMAAPNFRVPMDLSRLDFQTVRPPVVVQKSATLNPCRTPGELWAGVDPSTGQMVCRPPPVQIQLAGTCGGARPECNCRKMGLEARFPAVCVGSAWACNCDVFWLKRMGFI